MLDKEIQEINARPIQMGLMCIMIDVAFYMIMTMLNIATIKYVSVMFMISAIVLTEVINRIFPKNLSLIDSKLTPATSTYLGNKVSRMGISYTLAEALLVAVLLNLRSVKLSFAFFIQLAFLIIYVSFIAYHIRLNEEALEAVEKKKNKKKK